MFCLNVSKIQNGDLMRKFLFTVYEKVEFCERAKNKGVEHYD